ncbi:hypothetical protein STANM309S_04595 [Streptomyces tanashiensis]
MSLTRLVVTSPEALTVTSAAIFPEISPPMLSVLLVRSVTVRSTLMSLWVQLTTALPRD